MIQWSGFFGFVNSIVIGLLGCFLALIIVGIITAIVCFTVESIFKFLLGLGDKNE